MTLKFQSRNLSSDIHNDLSNLSKYCIFSDIFWWTDNAILDYFSNGQQIRTFWPNLNFLTKFENFWRNLTFLTKFENVYQIWNFRSNLKFLTKFEIFARIIIFFWSADKSHCSYYFSIGQQIRHFLLIFPVVKILGPKFLGIKKLRFC